MPRLDIDTDYLVTTLIKLLDTPSPSGYTDGVVHIVGDELNRVGIDFELTRRGAIRANLAGRFREYQQVTRSCLTTTIYFMYKLLTVGAPEARPG